MHFRWKIFAFMLIYAYLCGKSCKMCEEELQAWEWLKKVNERLTFIILKVQDRKEISEQDWDLLRVFYPLWYNQEYPFYATKMEGVSQSVTQASIFDAIPSDTFVGDSLKLCQEWDGTLLDGLGEEPKQEEE